MVLDFDRSDPYWFSMPLRWVFARPWGLGRLKFMYMPVDLVAKGCADYICPMDLRCHVQLDWRNHVGLACLLTGYVDMRRLQFHRTGSMASPPPLPETMTYVDRCIPDQVRLRCAKISCRATI